MKKTLLSSLIAAAAAVPAFAGVNNINYQAVIKDANGVMADKKVDMKFELLDKDGVVYSEEQTPTTNSAGLVVCQLGGEDALTDIEWGNLTLRVSIKLGADYEVISNEVVSSVPTALYAVKTADSDMIKEALENVIAEGEETKSTLQGMSAEIARIDGLAADFENLGENLDNAFTGVNTEIEDIKGQVENLNNVSAVVRVNEENIDLLTTEVEKLIAAGEETNTKILNMGAEIAMIEGLSNDFENLGENLDNSFTQMNAQIEEINGQIENLNNVSAVVRENEKAIEELNTNLDSSFTMVETRFDKIQSQADANTKGIEEINQGLDNFQESLERTLVPTMEITLQLQEEVEGLVKDNEETKASLLSYGAEIARIDGIAQDMENLGENLDNTFGEMNGQIAEINGQIENLNNVSAVVRENEKAIEELNTNLDSSFTMVETRFDKLQNQADATDQTVETLSDGVANLEELAGENGRLMTLIKELQNQVAELKAEVEALKGNN